MRSQYPLLQFLQVSRLGTIHTKLGSLSLNLGGARSSGVVLFVLGIGFLGGGGGGSHDEGMWVTQLQKLKREVCRKVRGQDKTARGSDR